MAGYSPSLFITVKNHNGLLFSKAYSMPDSCWSKLSQSRATSRMEKAVSVDQRVASTTSYIFISIAYSMPDSYWSKLSQSRATSRREKAVSLEQRVPSTTSSMFAANVLLNQLQ